MDALTVTGLIAGSFAATNLDNLALLVSWLLSGRGQPRTIMSGFLLGMLAVLAVAYAFGLGADQIPDQYVGYLGVIPILVGLKGIYAIKRSHRGERVEEKPGSDASLMLSIAATQVSNGMDTVLVFGPLLADSEMKVDFVIVGGFVAMAVVWFQLARFLGTGAGRIQMIERYGHWISPIVLIVVGLYILDNTATDIITGH